MHLTEEGVDLYHYSTESHSATSGHPEGPRLGALAALYQPWRLR